MRLQREHTELRKRARFLPNRVVPLWDRLPEHVAIIKNIEGFKEVQDVYWATVYPELGKHVSGVNITNLLDQILGLIMSFRNKRTYAALETTDTDRQHTNLDARVARSQHFVLCTLNRTEYIPKCGHSPVNPCNSTNGPAL